MLLAMFAAIPSAEVDRDRLIDWVVKLDGIGSRVAGTPGAVAAADLVADELTRLGLPVERRPFTVENPYSGGTSLAENVVASVGSTGPAWVVIAHLDSRGALDPADALSRGWKWDRDPAPGADDNASGRAALLELARLLSLHPPAQRVELVFSGAEEMAIIAGDGFMENLGADHVGGDVLGAIAVDMLLRARPWGSALRVYSDGRWGSSVIAQAVLHASWSEPLALEVRVDPSFTYSDHGSFWARGIGAVLVIEDDFHHARYHTAGDRFEAGDPFYSTEQLAQATRLLHRALTFLTN